MEGFLLWSKRKNEKYGEARTHFDDRPRTISSKETLPSPSLSNIAKRPSGEHASTIHSASVISVVASHSFRCLGG
jgi:hypothetical protein